MRHGILRLIFGIGKEKGGRKLTLSPVLGVLCNVAVLFWFFRDAIWISATVGLERLLGNVKIRTTQDLRFLQLCELQNKKKTWAVFS